MKRPLSQTVRSISPRLYSFLNTLRLLYARDSYLVELGLFESYKKGIPVDASGQPIPWMTYAATHFLMSRLTPDLSVFEFGSGCSTLFLAQRVKNIISVEYDLEWYKKLSTEVPPNAHLIFQEQDIDGDYCRTITKQQHKFDIIVVDGRDRVNCIKQSLLAISEQGVVILDDSNRKKYRPGIQALTENHFRGIDFTGLLPTGYRNYQTSVYYRDNNCLGI